MSEQIELTKDGRPRRRRSGGGRPPKYGEETRSIKVPISIPTELVTSIPDLQRALDYWEERSVAAGEDAVRYDMLRKMIEELRALGY